jgi:hypothetical protein
MPDYVTIKLYAETRKALRKIAAETGEQMVQVMDRLCQEEVRRLDELRKPGRTPTARDDRAG